MKPTVTPGENARLSINAAGEIEVHNWTVDLHGEPADPADAIRAIVEWALEKSLPKEVDLSPYWIQTSGRVSLLPQSDR